MTLQQLWLLRICLWLLSGLIFYIAGTIGDKILKLKIHMTKTDWIVTFLIGTVLGPITLLIILESLWEVYELKKKEKDANKEK